MRGLAVKTRVIGKETWGIMPLTILKRGILADSALEPDGRLSILLPAGLGDAGDQAVGGHFAESDTRDLEAAEKSTATAGDLAAIDKADRAGVAWELAQADIVLLCLELGTEFRPLSDGLALAFVSL